MSSGQLLTLCPSVGRYLNALAQEAVQIIARTANANANSVAPKESVPAKATAWNATAH